MIELNNESNLKTNKKIETGNWVKKGDNGSLFSEQAIGMLV